MAVQGEPAIAAAESVPRCPLCGGPLVDVRAKAVCAGCGRIAEGCCEGAPSACRPA